MVGIAGLGGGGIEVCLAADGASSFAAPLSRLKVGICSFGVPFCGVAFGVVDGDSLASRIPSDAVVRTVAGSGSWLSSLVAGCGLATSASANFSPSLSRHSR